MGVDDVGVSRRGWVVWVVVGVVVVAVGGVMLWVGLAAADKVGSVVGAVCGVVGLGLSGYGLVQARRGRSEERSVTNSITGPSVLAPVVQAGSIGRASVVGDRNVVGDGTVVAGPGGVAVGRGGSVVLAAVAGSAVPLPPPNVDLCVGRDRQVAEVVAGWVGGRMVAVVGGPGIGKSTVLGRAIGDDAVVGLFGSRRFVVSCEGAESAGAVVDKMAYVLGVALGDHLRNRVLSFLRGGPCVLVLDNFETVADGDPVGAAELVAELRSGPGQVALGIGYRGAGLTVGVIDEVEIKLGPLPDEAAVEVFGAVAGARHRADTNLSPLLADLDGVPLAIVLMATLARTEPQLDTLVTAWRAKRTDLLQRGIRPDRTSSLPVSIELSWDRLSPDARETLSLAALLPDGWPRGRSTMYLLDELAAGVIDLGGRALLHDDDLRQRCLAPIRRHVLIHHAPEPALLGGLVTTIRTLAERCRQIGGPDGADAVIEVVPEFTNIVEVIRAGLSHEPDLAEAVPALLEFQRFTGLGDDQLGLNALASAPSPSSRADNAFGLALLYTRRSDNDRARELFGQALPLYQQIRDRYSQAVAHAWLARTTNGERRSKHCAQLDRLAAELNLKGFRESLRAISGC